MSDFLTHLAARAIAPPTLRPRVRSRFEPEVEEAPAVLTEHRGPSAAVRPITPPAVSPPAALAVNPSVSEGSGRVGRVADGIAPPARPDRSLKLEMTRVEVPREVEREVQRVVETEQRIVRVPQIEERVVERERPHRFEAQPPRVIREPGRETEVRRERERTITIDRPTRIVSREAVRSETTQEPVVHVSIGRVEVRAVPQSQTQTPGARGPKMTIDDYVARRKAKERR